MDSNKIKFWYSEKSGGGGSSKSDICAFIICLTTNNKQNMNILCLFPWKNTLLIAGILYTAVCNLMIVVLILILSNNSGSLMIQWAILIIQWVSQIEGVVHPKIKKICLSSCLSKHFLFLFLKFSNQTDSLIRVFDLLKRTSLFCTLFALVWFTL